MSDETEPSGPEDVWRRTSALMKALGHPNRLALISQLREPTPISGVSLGPAEEGARERLLTRQGIRHHIQKLQDLDLVEAHLDPEGTGSEHVYETNVPQLFRVSEMLRALAASGLPEPTTSEPESPRSQAADDAPDRADTELPAQVVVVHGVDLGRSFPLEQGAQAENRGWVVGSSAEADVHLGEDGDVAEQHCEIETTDQGFELIDLRVSRSGTELNFDPLDRGAAEPLEHGDVIGAGSTLLLFQDSGPAP